jgi:hypothetical protein
MIKLENLEELKWLIKLSTLLEESGLSKDLVTSRRRFNSQLTVDEAEAIEKTLAKAGLKFTQKPSN